MAGPEDIAHAVEIKIAQALVGGYDEQARRLPAGVRAAVFTRDQGRCRLCGEPGEEVDHVNGPSSDLSNLRLLCRRCHEQVTRAHLTPIRDEATALRSREIWRRVHSALPERPSDDHQAWKAQRQTWLAEHRRRT